MVTAEIVEPAAARGAGAAREGEFVVVSEAGPAPGGRIAEAFAGVLAPAASTEAEVVPGQLLFEEFGGPAEFAADTGLHFAFEEGFPIVARGVAEADPDEVEEFVDEDAAALGGVAAQGGVEHEQTAARVAGGMDGCAGAGASFQAVADVAQVRAPLDADGFSVNGREFPEQRVYGWACPDKKFWSRTSILTESRTESTHLSRNSFWREI